MLIFAALVSVDVDATAGTIRNVAVEHLRHYHVGEHILTVETKTS
jgi:hypothetical protein